MKAVVGGRVLTVANGEIDQGVVLFDNGKFVAVGRNLDIPPGTEIIDAAHKYIVPGLIDAHTHIGMGDFGETTSPVTPHVRVLDGVDLGAPGFEDAVLSGVTTVIITPGSSNVVSGTSVVIKTAGRSLRERVLLDPAGMKVAWRKGTRQPSRDIPYPMSLMGIAGILRNELVKTRNYMARRERGQAEIDHPAHRGLEDMAKALRREIPIRIHSFTPVEIQAIFRLQDEFGFRFTVEHGFEAHFIADELARREVPVIYGPGPGLRRHKMFPHRGPHVPAILHRAGVKVSLQTDHPDRSIKQLRLFGAILPRYTDLTPDEVMRMLTLHGAEIAGVADRVGTIQAGKDADFAIFSDHPLKIQSRVEQVYIDGEQVAAGGKMLGNPFGAKAMSSTRSAEVRS